MPSRQQIFDETFLTLRSKLLDIAATLDRIDRAEGIGQDRPTASIADGIEILASPAPGADRARRMQILFSREYDPAWRESLKIG